MQSMSVWQQEPGNCVVASVTFDSLAPTIVSGSTRHLTYATARQPNSTPGVMLMRSVALSAV